MRDSEYRLAAIELLLIEPSNPERLETLLEAGVGLRAAGPNPDRRPSLQPSQRPCGWLFPFAGAKGHGSPVQPQQPTPSTAIRS